MAENKRFKYYKNDSTGQEFTIDNYRTGEFDDNELLSVKESIDLLNKYDVKYTEYRNDVLRLEKEKEVLLEENEQLKQSYTKLKHRHSLLHDECLDAECERDNLKKDVNSLEKENEQLKQENQQYKTLL